MNERRERGRRTAGSRTNAPASRAASGRRAMSRTVREPAYLTSGSSALAPPYLPDDDDRSRTPVGGRARRGRPARGRADREPGGRPGRHRVAPPPAGGAAAAGARSRARRSSRCCASLVVAGVVGILVLTAMINANQFRLNNLQSQQAGLDAAGAVGPADADRAAVAGQPGRGREEARPGAGRHAGLHPAAQRQGRRRCRSRPPNDAERDRADDDVDAVRTRPPGVGCRSVVGGTPPTTPPAGRRRRGIGPMTDRTGGAGADRAGDARRAGVPASTCGAAAATAADRRGRHRPRRHLAGTCVFTTRPDRTGDRSGRGTSRPCGQGRNRRLSAGDGARPTLRLIAGGPARRRRLSRARFRRPDRGRRRSDAAGTRAAAAAGTRDAARSRSRATARARPQPHASGAAVGPVAAPPVIGPPPTAAARGRPRPRVPPAPVPLAEPRQRASPAAGPLARLPFRRRPLRAARRGSRPNRRLRLGTAIMLLIFVDARRPPGPVAAHRRPGVRRRRSAPTGSPRPCCRPRAARSSTATATCWRRASRRATSSPTRRRS